MHAFVVAHPLDIHFAYGNTKSAIGTLGFVELYAEHSDTAEEAVQRAERAKETTEETEEENTAYYDENQKHKLPRKQGAENGEQAFVFGVGKQAYPSFKGACRTNVFAKTGYHENQGNGYDKHCQNHVF